MKFNFDRDWLERHAERDQNLEVAAGSFSLDQIPRGMGKLVGDPAAEPRADAFGRLIDLSRRKRGWSIEELAEASRIDISEAIRIRARPRLHPRSPHRLSVIDGVGSAEGADATAFWQLHLFVIAGSVSRP
jgi:hypothetical protein